MSAYVIYQAEVLDPEQYEKYKVRAAESVAASGGRYVVRGGEVDVLEGEPPLRRVVMLEFPDARAARAWYDGELYSQARAFREGAVRARAFIVDGIDSPGIGPR